MALMARARRRPGGDAMYNLVNMYTVGRGGPGKYCLLRHPHWRPSFLDFMASRELASNICQALGRGVTRSKGRAMHWLRKAAEGGYVAACRQLANAMYLHRPHAREVGRVGEATGVATSAGVTVEGHDVPPDVLASVVRLWKGGHNPVDYLNRFRRRQAEGAEYCRNDGCEVVGHRKDFKFCPQCMTARYCATRVRNRTGQQVGTRKRVAHSHRKDYRANPLPLIRVWDVIQSYHVNEGGDPGRLASNVHTFKVESLLPPRRGTCSIASARMKVETLGRASRVVLVFLLKKSKRCKLCEHDGEIMEEICGPMPRRED